MECIADPFMFVKFIGSMCLKSSARTKQGAGVWWVLNRWLKLLSKTLMVAMSGLAVVDWIR